MSLSDRRRRDLNPRAAINDLHPFQGCPFSLLGTSPNSLNPMIPYAIRGSPASDGEDGIRTHAPFRTNGFQDRLVIATSIPLQGCVLMNLTPVSLLQRLQHITTGFDGCQPVNLRKCIQMLTELQIRNGI